MKAAPVRAKPYPKYKASDVEWLGDVPQHWETKAIKWETPVFRGASPRPIDDPNYFDDEGEYAWVRIADVTASGMYLTETTQRLSDLGDALSVRLQPGALFLSIAGTVGKPCIAGIKCCIHDGFVYFPDWRGDTKFLYYIFASGEPYKGLGKFGTQLNLNTDTVGSIRIGVPPLLEQRAIANFLDAKTAVLDNLTAKKRDLLERLREHRTALISRAVTKGLPEAEAKAAGVEVVSRFKDSGVEWLGKVPEHWEVMQIRRKLLVLDCKHKTVEFVDDGIKVASIREVHGFEVDLSEAKQTTEDLYLEMIEGNRRPRIGDIIYSRNATVGEAALVTTNEKFCMGQDVCLIRSKSEHSRFLIYLFRSKPILEQLESLMVGSTFRRINVGQINSFWISLPPILEQRAIADYLDRETKRIDHIIARVEAALEKLTEYRTALITAAVTGKIDAREFKNADRD
jgi:type I restriction enzyme, S subunit